MKSESCGVEETAGWASAGWLTEEYQSGVGEEGGENSAKINSSAENSKKKERKMGNS